MKHLLAAAALVLVLAAPASAAAPTFLVGASGVVLPGTPAFAAKPTNLRQVYRVGTGVYCVAPGPSFDWSSHTPLVAPLPALSKKRSGTLLATWDAGGQRCPAAAIQVRTYRLLGGLPKAANDVAFHLLVGGSD
ncbi:MAG TPA: hypothetical protein VFL60_01565 [Gaiellaceae bacterium]|nr:hypothetical protein [Gaiellaceae bacterium]